MMGTFKKFLKDRKLDLCTDKTKKYQYLTGVEEKRKKNEYGEEK